MVFTFDFYLITLKVNTKTIILKEKKGMKKVQKTIKINYILHVAIKDYAEKNDIDQIEVIEKAITEFFKEKEDSRVHYEILEAVQLLLNNQITISTDLENIKNVLDNTEIV
ncbi:hypothetical protein CSQ88_07515 [Iodobacter sp. BJB302]|nr:hypothetical protein CSQ88_07515 [Iodobacter sp. BJB302]